MFNATVQSVATPARFSPQLPPWKVLIVDDDETVHLATRLVLANMRIDGRPLELVHAYSGAQAVELAKREAGFALAMIDVVMEQPDAGLQCVRTLRETLGRRAMRIILRTGQPGYVPDIETVQSYDINDYWAKTDLTRSRLMMCLITAVRAYRQFVEIEHQRDTAAELLRTLELSRQAERDEAKRRASAERELCDIRATMAQCIEQRTADLREVAETLGEFNRRVAHDLQGPLRGLLNLTSLSQGRLAQGEVTDVKRCLGTMGEQIQRMLDLIDGLTSLSQVGHTNLPLSRIELVDLVHEARQTVLMSRPESEAMLCLVDQLPQVQVNVPLLRQVMVNLLDNAWKFSCHQERPQVEVSAEFIDHQWVICVRDNGKGFDNAQAERIFQPFTLTRGGEATDTEGAGIGLTLVQSIVRRHGGQVWAQGEPGHGAVIRFSLPA